MRYFVVHSFPAIGAGTFTSSVNSAYRRCIGLLTALLATVLLTACADGNDTRLTLEEASFWVRESVRQLHVSGAQESQMLGVYDAAGTQLASGEADALGGLIFRDLPPGSNYTVREVEGERVEAVQNLDVWSVEQSMPDQSFYSDQVASARLQLHYNARRHPPVCLCDAARPG